MFDAEGREVPGNRGYKYFGAAKDLPGVRELFEQEPPPPPRKTRAELMKDIDADYYGYRDDDDGVLIPLEEKAEKVAILKALIEWKEKQKAGAKDDDDEEEIYPTDKSVSLKLRWWRSYLFKRSVIMVRFDLFCSLIEVRASNLMIRWDCLHRDLPPMFPYLPKRILNRRC